MRRLTNAQFSAPLRAWFERGRHYTVAGQRVFVVDVQPTESDASRTPLLVLHGFPTSSRDFHLVLPELARGRRVLLADFPGFGFSDKPERYTYSIFEQADVVEALLGQLQIQRPHVLAHDMGVAVACELLARHKRRLMPAGLHSLCLMSAGLYEDLAKLTPAQRMLLTPFGKVFAGLGVGQVFKLQMQRVFRRRVDATELDLMWEQILYLDGHKRLPDVAGYLRERGRFEDRWISALRTSDDVPVRLLWGNSDPTAVVEIAQRLSGGIPGAQLIRLPKVGHYPHLEAPQETVEAINGWLSELDRRAATIAAHP
jgi:pimeloyl-ACP methyl ester carboxylesterase